MQKIINQILEGNFDYENGSLDFSCAKIELSIKKGQQYEGSFHIYATPDLFTNGKVVSSDWRMECLVDEFSGSDEEIPFLFHGELLEEGDVVKGAFNIISNHGEYYLPFVVSMEHMVPESSGGSIKNLFHFANLAKSNWHEAVKLFYSPEFKGILTGNDAQYAEDYRALAAYDGQEQNVEEFLVRINKKQTAEFVAEAGEMFVELSDADASYAVVERELAIMRNGWGFTQLFVECQGDFLFTEKEMLTDDDFLGNHCRLPVFIDSALCRNGKSYGRICLYNSYVTLDIPVTVKKTGGSLPNAGRERKRQTLKLMELYQAFRIRKISTSAWLKETGKLVEKMVAMDEEDISIRLFRAQLLITEGSLHEAGWILDNVADVLQGRKSEDALLAYYLYLTTLVHGDAGYISRVARDVENIYRRNASDWRVGWLLLYLSEDFRKSDKKKWQFLEQLYTAGCSSPVLYLEAVGLLNGNPVLLRKLGGFERQALYYGAKEDIVKQDVVEQMLYLSGKLKEYSNVIFKTLELLYRKKKDERLVEEICILLIKNGKTGSRYFEWYKAGLEAQLRITNLYEYYMMSMDLDRQQELPKAVLMYFSYQNNLDHVHSAYLYDYILQRRDKMGEIYEAYKYKMERFAVSQIQKGRINRHLADIYNKLLQPEMVNEQTCGPLSRLLFAHLIQVEDDRLRKVYVYQPGNVRPTEYVLTNRHTWVSLYGNNYTIVFEDAWRNRFIKSVEYTIEKLMRPGKFLRWLLPLVNDNRELDLYLCDKDCPYRKEMQGSIERELRVAASDYADSKIKRDLYLSILQYYLDIDDMRALDKYLTQIPAEELTAEERGSVIRFMVLRGNYDLAWKWLEAYGPYFVDAKILVRLLSPIIVKHNMMEAPVLTAAAAYVFRKGKYDSTVLEYLAMYYQGMTRDIRDIWKAARSFDVDCYRLCERMLVQMLYSGAFVGEKMEIFRYYISQGGKQEIEQAFLSQCAYDYFVKEHVTEKEVFHEILHLHLQGEPVPKVCKLAFLKYYAENRAEQDENREAAQALFLREMMEEGIQLEFFKAFKDCPALQQELADKTIIEYRAQPQAKVRIHYIVLGEDGEADGYRQENMREAYSGVFFKEFVLFFGESIQYYITEEKDGEEQLTESATIQKNDRLEPEEDSRYRLINDIMISKSMHDYDTMDNLLEEYYKRDFLNGKLFELK